jgi:hypothetical protein
MRIWPSLSFRCQGICGLLLMSGCLVVSCSVAEPRTSASDSAQSVTSKAAGAANSSKGATIPIDTNGPADTVRVFYKDLREKKFRDAIFLTNLKPAIAGLNDTELKDFAVDFEEIAGQVPTEVQINGEMISGDKASVTVNLPKTDADDDKNEIQTINLRKGGDIWVILIADEAAEAKMKQEGSNYFYTLRIETHESEAKKMLQRVTKAELVYSLKNGGTFADLDTLITGGLLPDDIRTSESTGYDYTVTPSTDKKKYSATATPSIYGKSGKLSFALTVDSKNIPHMNSKDNGGKPLSK